MRTKLLSIFISAVIVTAIFPPIIQSLGQQNIPSSVTGGSADSPWPMFRQNYRHTGQSPYDTSGNQGNLNWSFTTNSCIRSSPVIDSNGTIYVGSQDDNLYAINADGTEKWHFTTGGWVGSTPAIGSDNTIYVGSMDYKFYAIKPDGTEKWHFTTGGNIHASPTIGFDGTIYICSYDGNLYAINPDGTAKWHFTTGGNIDSSPAIGSDGTIYFGSQDGKFYAVNPDGTEKWSFAVDNWISAAPAIGADGTIYVGSQYDNKLYAINPDGTEKWSFAVDNHVKTPGIGSDGTIYVGSSNSRLYAINPDGTEKWSFLTGGVVASSPAIGSDGTIFVGSHDSKLHAIYPNGTARWSFTTGDFVSSSPAIGSDGMIYVGSLDFNLYAIGTPTPTLEIAVTSHFLELNSAAQSSITVHVTDGTNPVQGATVNLASDNGGIFSPQSGITDTNGDFKSIFNAPTVTSQIICKISAEASKTGYNNGSGYVGVTINPIPWPMFRQNLNHTGVSPYDTSSNPGKLKWSYTTNGQVDSSAAIGKDGTIYVGSQDGNLYAIYRNGTLKWRFKTDVGIESSPAIDSNGIIYVVTKLSTHYAINPDGTEKWNYTIGDESWESSAAIGSDGTIYIGCYIENKLVALNPDGTHKWTHSFGDGYGVRSSPAIGIDGTIYVGSGNGELYAINPDGTRKWQITLGNRVNSSPTIGTDGTIYIGSCFYNPTFHAINPDGTKKWDFNTGLNIVVSSPAFTSDGIIYTGSQDSKLYAINLDGFEKWNFTTGSSITSSPSIGIEGSVYIASQDGNLYALNPDGTQKWIFKTGGSIMSSPVIDYDGTIYIGSRDHNLYAIGIPENEPPTAEAGPDQTVKEGDSVSFDASYDPYGTIVTYEWDFDVSDGLWWETGAPPDAIGPTSIYVYGDDGVYTVTLKVTDDNGETDTDECSVTVNNVAPAITLMMTYPDDEGSQVTFEAESTDPGSDDVTYSWELEYGPTIENTFHNNGVSPEPVYDPASNEVKSPSGTYPFHTSDVATHIFGDNYDYTIILTVTDDDGGESIYTATVTVDNLAPSIREINIPSDIEEGSSTIFEALASDQGSDDLTFTWEFELGSTITNVYYNDGINSDPYPSPWGNYPFNAADNVDHTYGDNGVYGIDLTIEDDDGGVTTYSTDINIRNVAPTIDLVTAPDGDEGSDITFSSTATDQGSDDMTFKWEWGDGTLDTINFHYNDGIGPDPPRSPLGAYPFTVTDTVSHIYGDDGNYTITLTVEDDDGDLVTYTTTVTINNVAPTIEPFGPFSMDEGLSLDLTTTSTDPGSDDLTFIWEFELGPTITNIYYNDGLAPDPYPSPLGTFPYSASDSVEHTYGDDGVYPVKLTVCDDDGGMTSFMTNITVNNVVPTIVSMEAYMYVNFTLRVAGEKYHSVGIHLYEQGTEIWAAQVTRHPGSPDEQATTISGLRLDMTKTYSATVEYLPNDPRVNGNVWGGNPVWIDITFENGSVRRLHHTFNVRQSYWDSDHWNHIDPWEVDLNDNLVGCAFEVTSHITDPGSDDIFLTYTYGSQIVNVTYLNNPPNPDPYPSPEVNPVNITDTTTLVYEGSGTVTLVVKDDDNIRLGVGEGTDIISVG